MLTLPPHIVLDAYVPPLPLCLLCRSPFDLQRDCTRRSENCPGFYQPNLDLAHHLFVETYGGARPALLWRRRVQGDSGWIWGSWNVGPVPAYYESLVEGRLAPSALLPTASRPDTGPRAERALLLEHSTDPHVGECGRARVYHLTRDIPSQGKAILQGSSGIDVSAYLIARYGGRHLRLDGSGPTLSEIPS